MSVFLDLTKAIDTVSHYIFIDKMKVIGIRNYLNNRLQSVNVGFIHSVADIIKMGIPQGTVLVPLLFLYTLMSNLQLKGKILSYADETVFILQGRLAIFSEK